MNQSDDQKSETTASTSGETRLTKNGSISYLFLPAVDVHQSAACYEQIFGWEIRGRDTDHPCFDDGTGHLSGAWATNQAIAREPSLLAYIYVDRIDEIRQQIETQGGEIVKAPYPEGNLWVATFREPAGLVIGLWHEGARCRESAMAHHDSFGENLAQHSLECCAKLVRLPLAPEQVS